jgi:hypothetical protein
MRYNRCLPLSAVVLLHTVASCISVALAACSVCVVVVRLVCRTGWDPY